MKTRLYDVTLVTAAGPLPHCAIDLEDGRIAAVHETLPERTPEALDCGGTYAIPGFVDIHVHGGGGIEFMNASPAEIRSACAAHARHGTTTILPTSFTASLESTVEMIENVRLAQAETTECTIGGVHLEGPFLSPRQAGAQDPTTLIHPTEEAIDRLLSAWPEGIRMVGAAPELPGAMELGRLLRSKGICASIAHSDADYADCVEAMANGYRDVTHIYSGCSMVHRVNGYRFGGVVEAGLVEDGLTVQVIADGKHLPAELLKLIFKCKGADRIAVITDALFTAAADLPDGYVVTQSNGMDAILEDGVMKMPDRQAFAGSIATMDRQLRNMVQLAGVSLYDAVKMTSATPAKIVGLDHRKGHLKPGWDADIVLLDQNLQVKQVYAMGKPV